MSLLTIIEALKERPGKRGSDEAGDDVTRSLAKRVRGVNLHENRLR